jgi:hypothetical protein
MARYRQPTIDSGRHLGSLGSAGPTTTRYVAPDVAERMPGHGGRGRGHRAMVQENDDGAEMYGPSTASRRSGRVAAGRRY